MRTDGPDDHGICRFRGGWVTKTHALAHSLGKRAPGYLSLGFPDSCCPLSPTPDHLKLAEPREQFHICG